MFAFGLLMISALLEGELAPLASPPTAIASLANGELLMAQRNGNIVVLNQETGGDSVLNEEVGNLWATLETPAHTLSVDPQGTQVLVVRNVGPIDRYAIERHDAEPVNGNLKPAGKPAPLTGFKTSAHLDVRVVWNLHGTRFATWSPSRHWNSPQGPAHIWTHDGQLTWTGPQAFWIDTSPTTDTFAVMAEGELWMKPTGSDANRTSIPELFGCLAFSPDGAQLAVTLKNGDLFLLDAKTLERSIQTETRRLLDMGFPITAMRMKWSPDGKALGLSTSESMYLAIMSIPNTDIL